MDLTKLVVCCALVLIIMTDVVCSRSLHNEESLQWLETVVEDIDQRLIRSERNNSRRRRRHLQTQQIALMEFCLKSPSRCRAAIEAMRTQGDEIRIVVIQK